MNKSQILNTIKFIGKSILVLLTCLLIFAYSIALIEKIQRPTFKNLPTNEFIIIGIILLILIFINLKWVFRIFKNNPNEK
jgi:protein-S-isoprenylcysteine O-methyltransferase Ste14